MARKRNAGAVTVMDAAEGLSSATEEANSGSHIGRAWLIGLCDTLAATGHLLTLTVDENSDGLLLYAVPQEIET